MKTSTVRYLVDELAEALALRVALERRLAELDGRKYQASPSISWKRKALRAIRAELEHEESAERKAAK